MSSEEKPVNMTGQEENTVRMAGYLDKRGKMKLVTTWKRYWFVLKNQLLLYYKSQEECLNLSACRGSINMGLVSSVRPGAHRGPPATAVQGFIIEVETRTQVVLLRSKERSLQEKWLKALLESMSLPNISSPVRTCGGPIHFRYSMENLPVVEEAKTEDKREQTVPHQTLDTSHDIMLGRIKRIGGLSYGGNLDTILRHQPKSQVQPRSSPQQPNIPRIKAVDRMLGLHNSEGIKTDEIMINEKEGSCLVKEGQCSSDSTYSVSKDEISMRSGGEDVKCNEVSLHRSVAISSNIQETRESNFKLRRDENNKQTDAAVVARVENQNQEKANVTCIREARKHTTDFLENERHVCCLENVEEILVENKLYEKSKGVENGDEDEIYDETTEMQQIVDCREVENKLYKNKLEKEDKEYDSVDELSSFSQGHVIPEDEKMYEVVTASVDAVKQAGEDVQSSEGTEEDYYYSGYDKFSFMRSLSDQLNSSSPEPDLPPRPLLGCTDSPKCNLAHEDAKTDDEEADYSQYYDSPETFSNSSSPSHFLSSGNVCGKKKYKLRVKMKLRKKKSPSKETVFLEDGNNNNKSKRKLSFLHRMLKHYQKKPENHAESVMISDNSRIYDEPEYESVDYMASVLKHEDTEEELPEYPPRRKSTESLDKALHKEKLFGTKNILTEQTLNELKKKLKDRDNAAPTEPPVSAKEDNEKHEGVSSKEVLEKKPIPTPRSNKQKLDQDNKDHVVESSRYRCNDSITRENKPPSLPPRRVARPRSPWHDVPKNNSPIYGNFQELGINTGEIKEDKNKESPEPTFEKQPKSSLGEWHEEFKDKLLGTPHGFVCVQNKWKAVEKSGERFFDQQGNEGKSSFQKSSQEEMLPGKCNNMAEVEVKHVRITSNNHASSDILSHEHKANSVLVANMVSSNIYSDVHKEHLSVQLITKDFNSQSEKTTAKDGDLSDTYSQMVDNELSFKNWKKPTVPKKSNDFEFNGNFKMKAECTKEDYRDTCDDRIVNNINGNLRNFKLNTTHQEDFLGDISVTHRKSKTGTMSMCNRSEILCRESEKCLVLINGENENFSSSQFQNTRVSTEETKEKAHVTNNDCVCSDSSSMSTDSLVTEEIKTVCNPACNQNVLQNRIAEDLSDRTVGNTESAGYKDRAPHFHRHSDELNLLLTQLAEITSAPLLPHGVASSLVDIPKTRKPNPEANEPSQLGPTQQESIVLVPIRRRRHSDPDYDVPRPHGSLLHLLLPNGTSSHSGDHRQSGQESDAIEATRFFGDVDMSSSSAHSSLSLRDHVISEVDEQSDISYYVSMAPDSLELPLTKDIEESK